MYLWNKAVQYSFRLLISLSLFSSVAYCYEETEIEKNLRANFFTPEISTVDIADWQNPTPEDYWKLQVFMKERHVANLNTSIASRPFPTEYLNTEFYGWLTYRSGRIALVDSEMKAPGRHIFYGNNDPNKKDKCVICYAGNQSRWNDRDYIRGINLIIESLKKSNFDGHFIYYIGGWPSLKRDRLKYVDVPFAFKPFLFEEARDLGYQNILWVDACSVPVKNLDPVFNLIQKQGLCFYHCDSIIKWREFNEGYKHIMPWLKLSPSKKYEEISSQVVGLNMGNKNAVHLLDEWLKAAERRIPFLQSDEPPFMYLVNDLKLTWARMPKHFYTETPCNTGNFNYKNVMPKAIIYHQYDFLNPNYPIPADLFSN